MPMTLGRKRALRLVVITLLASLAGLSVLGARLASGAELTLDALSLLTRSARSGGEAPDTLVANGLTFDVTTGTARASLRQVLDDFQARCPRTDALLADLAPGATAVQSLAARLSREVVARIERKDRGIVACLVPADARPLRERLAAFATSLDVALLGRVELVVAAAAGQKTTYAVLRSRGPLPLRAAFPAGGDAPGRDPEGTPRPAGSVRLLSVSGGASSPAVVVYATHGMEAEEMLLLHREALERQRWVVEPHLQGRDRVVAHRAGRVTVVVATEDEKRVLTTVFTL